MTAAGRPRRAQRTVRLMALLARAPDASAMSSAQRTLVWLWSLWRFGTIVTYGPAIPGHVTDRRSRWVLPVLTVAVTVEGVWATRAVLAAGDGAEVRRVLAIDGVVNSAVILASYLDCKPEAINTDTAWPQHLGVTMAGLAATRLTLADTLVTAAAMGLVVGWAERRVAGDRGRRMEWNYVTMGIAARVLQVITGSLGTLVDQYQATAEEAGERLGRLEASRTVSADVVDRSFDVLARLSSTADRSDQRRLATAEVLRLRWILDGHDTEPDALTSAIWDVVADSAADGLSVELLTREVSGEVDERTRELLCRFVGATLGALAATTRVRRALVRIRTTADGAIAATVRPRRPVADVDIGLSSGWGQLARAVGDAHGRLAGPVHGRVSDPEWRLSLPAASTEVEFR